MTRQRKKLLNAIVYFAQNTKVCHKLKLMKLLYYLDFWHFKETGKSVTGLTYKAWEKGPVPPNIYHEVEPLKNPPDLQEYVFVESLEFENKEGRYLHFQPKKPFNEKIFTRRELEILDRVALVFRDARAQDMTDSTHLKNSPWSKTLKEKGDSAQIDYMLALDDDEKSLSPETVLERMKLDSEMRQIIED